MPIRHQFSTEASCSLWKKKQKKTQHSFNSKEWAGNVGKWVQFSFAKCFCAYFSKHYIGKIGYNVLCFHSVSLCRRLPAPFSIWHLQYWQVLQPTVGRGESYRPPQDSHIFVPKLCSHILGLNCSCINAGNLYRIGPCLTLSLQLICYHLPVLDHAISPCLLELCFSPLMNPEYYLDCAICLGILAMPSAFSTFTILVC